MAMGNRVWMPRNDGCLRRSGMALFVVVCVYSFVSRPALSSAQPILLRGDRSVETVRINVFSLFRPGELVLRPANGASLAIELEGHTQTLSQGFSSLLLHVSGGQVTAQFDGANLSGESLQAHAAGTNEAQPVSFVLEVPGKLRRMYFGALEVRARGPVLEAVVTMPLETAVASVVEAESPPNAGLEALEAQAVAARSFFVARQAAHVDFDFCDTTHCQFLRSPPKEGTAASRAARETAGLILTWHDEEGSREQVLAAMYARSCGGRTRTLRDIGVASRGYPYYAVRCVYCSHHPEVWKRDAALATEFDLQTENQPMPMTERERLAFNRIHGWGALPSLGADAPGQPGAAQGKSEERSVSGRGVGHGLGLCQRGAADMARHGAGFAAILTRYYPNTRLTTMTPP